MVEVGVGIGIVPEMTARRAARTMAITTIPLRDDWALRDLRLCARNFAALSPSASRLVDYLGVADDPDGKSDQKTKAEKPTHESE